MTLLVFTLIHAQEILSTPVYTCLSAPAALSHWRSRSFSITSNSFTLHQSFLPPGFPQSLGPPGTHFVVLPVSYCITPPPMSFLPSWINLHSTYVGLSLLAPLSVHCTHLAKATPLDKPNYTTTQHLQSCSRMWLCTHIYKYTRTHTHTLSGLNLHSWSLTARRCFLLQSNPPGLPFHIFPPPTPLPQLHCHLITLYFTSQRKWKQPLTTSTHPPVCTHIFPLPICLPTGELSMVLSEANPSHVHWIPSQLLYSRTLL